MVGDVMAHYSIFRIKHTFFYTIFLWLGSRVLVSVACTLHAFTTTLAVLESSENHLLKITCGILSLWWRLFCIFHIWQYSYYVINQRTIDQQNVCLLCIALVIGWIPLINFYHICNVYLKPISVIYY